jgi:hypothetical protein
MSHPAIVCNSCGKELTAADKFCAQCGSPVRLEKVTPNDNIHASPVTCEVCGHRNTQSGSFCEACGAKLPGRKDSSASEKKSTVQSSKQKRSPSKSKLETWHYVLGAVVVGLAGFFIYVEVSREAPANSITQQSMPIQLPNTQPATPPSKDILDAITRLEGTVKGNPNDPGAKLLLANALHDAGTHDGSYFPRAIETYKAYLKQNPGDPNARVDLGICYFELGKLDSAQSGSLFSLAIDEMESTMKTNPKHQPGAFNLGIVYLYTGNIQQSNKWFSKSVELNPESDLGKRAKEILEQHSQAIQP